METSENKQDQLNAFAYFPSMVYTMSKPEFLPAVKKVVKEHLDNNKNKLDEIYPVKMTGNLFDDARMDEFTKYVGQTSWNILAEQGYQMDPLNTFFTEMWCQEHHKHSAMEQHIHGFGVQLVGFYFIDTPKDCSKVIFHDPRAGKVQTNLPELDGTNATIASNMINFTPEPGMLMFTNSYLAHSFSRHASSKPIRFIHFNVAVREALQAQTCQAPAEVI